MSEAILGLEFGKPQAPPSMNGGDNPDNNEAQKPEEAEDDEDGPPPSKRSRHRKTVGFDSVTVYYFQRMQGFTCVPSQGGSTLGMSPMHVEKRTFSLQQHAHERRRLQFGEVDCSNTSSSSSLSPDDTAGPSAGDGGNAYQGGSSALEAVEDTPEEDDAETLSYLQPVPTRQRRALLRASGVRKIDALEKEECRDIRASREFCGCACKGRCLPETCSCSIAGISCQVDRLSFPCGCTQEGCGNTSGRTEFNPVRVRAHFLRTLMRLEIEKQGAAGDLTGDLTGFQCVNPHQLIYYNAAAAVAASANGTAAPGVMALPAAACHYSSEEEDEEDSSYSENSDYSTEEEDGSGGDATDLTDGRPGSPHRDYTDLSCAVARGSPALASRGVVPVDPVFVGCGDCATDGLMVSPAEGSQAASSTSTTEEGEGSSSTATTDSTFGEIIKASLGEVATLL